MDYQVAINEADPSWGQCIGLVMKNSPSGALYLGRMAKYATGRDIKPASMTDADVEGMMAADPGFAARASEVNTAINRFNEAATHFGFSPLRKLANRGTARAAANGNLAPRVLGEVSAYKNGLSVGSLTADCKVRRLMSVARKVEELGCPIATFRDVADPAILADYSASFEKDVATVSVNTRRKRELDEVAALAEANGWTVEEDRLRAFIKNLPKAGLEMAASTERGVLSLDASEADDFLLENSLEAIETFRQRPSRTTMWQAQAAFGTLIILQEVRDLAPVAGAWIERQEIPGGRLPRLFIKPKAGQDEPVDIGAADESGVMQQAIVAYDNGVRAYENREASALYEKHGGALKSTCAVSNDIHRFWAARGLQGITPTVLRDHVVTQATQHGDREAQRDLSGTKYLNNAYHRYRGVIGTAAKDRAVDKALKHDNDADGNE